LLCALRIDAAPALMLAGVYREPLQAAEYLVSEKLDGVRGRWDGRRLITRGGQLIATPAWFTAGWPDTPLDGELWIGRGQFEPVSALVRSATPQSERWRAVRFMLFDLPAHAGVFAERVEAMQALVARTGSPQLQMIPQHRVSGGAELEARLQRVLAEGGEGLMLHHRQAHYRPGRSDALLKLKPFEDAEGTVVGYRPGRGKYRGMTGALVLELDNGRQLRLGSGLSDAERAHPPPLGSRVSFRHSGLTSTGLPRFARYLRLRHD
jgi:DNA ligase-1